MLGVPSGPVLAAVNDMSHIFQPIGLLVITKHTQEQLIEHFFFSVFHWVVQGCFGLSNASKPIEGLWQIAIQNPDLD